MTRQTRYTRRNSTTGNDRCAKAHDSASASPEWPIVEDLLDAAFWFPSWTAMATFVLLLAADTESDAEALQLQVLAQGIQSIGHFTEFDLDWTITMHGALASDGRLSDLRGYFYNRRQLMTIFSEFDLDELDEDRPNPRAESHH